MKIAVMTIHNALNYGAVFQAYATQEILSKYGKVEIINYQNKHIEKVYKTFNIRLNHNMPKDLVRDLYLLKSKLLKKSKFNEFFKNKFVLTLIIQKLRRLTRKKFADMEAIPLCCYLLSRDEKNTFSTKSYH